MENEASERQECDDNGDLTEKLVLAMKNEAVSNKKLEKKINQK